MPIKKIITIKQITTGVIVGLLYAISPLNFGFAFEFPEDPLCLQFREDWSDWDLGSVEDQSNDLFYFDVIGSNNDFPNIIETTPTPIVSPYMLKSISDTISAPMIFKNPIDITHNNNITLIEYYVRSTSNYITNLIYIYDQDDNVLAGLRIRTHSTSGISAFGLYGVSTVNTSTNQITSTSNIYDTSENFVHNKWYKVQFVIDWETYEYAPLLNMRVQNVETETWGDWITTGTLTFNNLSINGMGTTGALKDKDDFPKISYFQLIGLNSVWDDFSFSGLDIYNLPSAIPEPMDFTVSVFNPYIVPQLQRFLSYNYDDVEETLDVSFNVFYNNVDEKENIIFRAYDSTETLQFQFMLNLLEYLGWANELLPRIMSQDIIRMSDFSPDEYELHFAFYTDEEELLELDHIWYIFEKDFTIEPDANPLYVDWDGVETAVDEMHEEQSRIMKHVEAILLRVQEFFLIPPPDIFKDMFIAWVDNVKTKFPFGYLVSIQQHIQTKFEDVGADEEDEEETPVLSGIVSADPVSGLPVFAGASMAGIEFKLLDFEKMLDNESLLSLFNLLKQIIGVFIWLYVLGSIYQTIKTIETK